MDKKYTNQIMPLLDEEFYKLVKSNIASYHNKVLSQDLIDLISRQIIESVDFFVKRNESQ